MKLIDSLVLSTRMFKTRPLRTFLTVLGVGVGIGAVLFLVSLGYGLQNLILSQITTTDSLLSLDVQTGSSDLVSLREEHVRDIRNIESVEEVSPVSNLSSQISMGSITSNSMVKAVDNNFFRLNGTLTQFGQALTSNDKYEAVISSAGSKLFNMEPEDIIGEEVSISLFLTHIDEDGYEEVDIKNREEKYKIIGVVEDNNDNYIFISGKTLDDLNIDNFNLLKVKVDDESNMEMVRQKIIAKGFLVSSLSDTIDQAKQIFKVVQIVLALFGLIALTVSAIGMFNTMTVSLLERISEIGIMRAIGVTTHDIIKMFLLESILMGFLGGVGGVVIGYLAGFLSNFGLNFIAQKFGGQSLDLFYQPPWFVLFIIFFSTIVGFVTGIYPSIKASRINPLNALRYK
ncbi:ABC transporter permease [bacterium]|nr:ABC transporter permease [bacterium]